MKQAAVEPLPLEKRRPAGPGHPGGRARGECLTVPVPVGKVGFSPGRAARCEYRGCLVLTVHCHKSFGRSDRTSRPLSATSGSKIQPDLVPEAPTSARRAAPARGEDAEVGLVWTSLEEEPKESYQ